MPRWFASSREWRQLLSEHARWRGLGWILSWLGVACLLLSLGLEASAHQPPPVACYRSMGRSRTLVSRSSYQLLRRASTKFIHCRTGPRESSFAPNFFLPVERCRFLGTTMAGLWWATGYELGAPGQLQGCRSRRQHPARGRARFLPEIPAGQWLKLKTRGFVPAFS